MPMSGPLLRQFASPLVLILLFGAAVSMALRDWVNATIILAIVLGSALLGFLQEHRANRALAALRSRLALSARVVRDGAERVIPASEVQPGDVLLLAAGNLLPADGTVLEARDFLLSEASLTGESFPVERSAGERVFLGTSVRSGTARVRAEAVGGATVYGAIEARLHAAEPEPQFARGVRRFGYFLLQVMVLVVVFVLAVNQLLGRAPVESLLFAVALAVGLSPELLPAIVTVTLSHGARAMASRGVLVRRLEAIEDLGSIDILCTDKTGTLTEGAVTLEAALDPAGRPSSEVARLAFLNAELETGIDNPLDAAIVAAGKKAGLSADGVRKVDEIPYDFIRKRLTIVVEEEGRHLIVTKGAFDTVLAACPVAAEERARLEAWYRRKGEEGYRVLGVATRSLPPRERYSREDERDMAFAGFLVFADPPKAQAKHSLHELAAIGVRIKVVTGDNRHVAAHVAAAVGIDASGLLTGAQVGSLTDAALRNAARHAHVFAEIEPQQKERIVRALQQAGHAVGYLGDGINDAPALRAADVGISVESAVDVARESSDVVLLSADLEVLRGGVEGGRRTFVNTLKYVSITTSSTFGNMVSMALATPVLPFLPLAAKQILLNNFLADLPFLAVASDNVERARIARAQRWNLHELRRFMLVFGLTSTLFDLVSFAVLLLVLGAGEATFQSAWFVISLLTEVAAVLVLRTHGPAWRSRPGALLLGSALAVGAGALALPFVPPLGRAFGFVPLPAGVFAAACAIVLAYVLAIELAKRAYYGRGGALHPGRKAAKWPPRTSSRRAPR